MKVLDIILILIGIKIIDSVNKDKKKELMTGGGMLNIYDEPLQQCGSSQMTNGSWDSEGKCSEIGGGVHQICIKNISKNTPRFSLKTGQSSWSDNRGNDNHCVCLGAWALYNAKNKNLSNENILKCDAIPNVSLSKDYVRKFDRNSQGWDKWNNLETNNQVIDGVEALVKNCYNFRNPQVKDNNLKKNFCNMAKDVTELKNTNTYRRLKC
tara:strand:- start:110 stop:739 length:630 start_codon:yes stop_codon:yes gene_type:complete